MYTAIEDNPWSSTFPAAARATAATNMYTAIEDNPWVSTFPAAAPATTQHYSVDDDEVLVRMPRDLARALAAIFTEAANGQPVPVADITDPPNPEEAEQPPADTAGTAASSNGHHMDGHHTSNSGTAASSHHMNGHHMDGHHMNCDHMPMQ